MASSGFRKRFNQYSRLAKARKTLLPHTFACSDLAGKVEQLQALEDRVLANVAETML